MVQMGVPMLLDERHLAQGFRRSEEPGKIVSYAGIAVHFYESVAVLGHEAPELRSLLCAAHHPMLAFNHENDAVLSNRDQPRLIPQRELPVRSAVRAPGFCVLRRGQGLPPAVQCYLFTPGPRSS